MADVLAKLEPTGEVFVNGLASSYDDEYPDSKRLRQLITREDFDKAVAMINDALMDHWPCLPCKGFGYGCCVCTLGLSLYCAATQVQEAESRLQLQLGRLNDQAKFKDKGVKWRLERTWWKRSSFIEITVDTEVAAGAGDSRDTAEVNSEAVEAVRDETITGRDY